jgi:hypothetical protein
MITGNEEGRPCQKRDMLTEIPYVEARVLSRIRQVGKEELSPGR